jgi:glutathione synthase
MSKTVAFVMNPMDRVNTDTDTSFAFMLAAQDRDMRVMHVEPTGVSIEHDQVVLTGQQVQLRDAKTDFYEKVGDLTVDAADCAAIFIRTDPPFDEDYLITTWMLSFAEKNGTRIINSPRGLRSANEHIYTLEFAKWCPPTIVSASAKAIKEFVNEMGGEAIAKPVNGHGGEGVLRLRNDDSNMSSIIDVLTKDGTLPILVQRFLPEVKDGDKRLIFIDGKLRAAVRRIPTGGDHRSNVHVGGQTVAAEITESDKALAADIGPRFKADGLFFVGIDVIGDRLTDINVTSPTLLREIQKHGGPNLADEVLAAI